VLYTYRILFAVHLLQLSCHHLHQTEDIIEILTKVCATSVAFLVHLHFLSMDGTVSLRQEIEVFEDLNAGKVAENDAHVASLLQTGFTLSATP
jgi:Holliday junction resolvasome RuvABC ATP-dependent DNA helicase subunit